MANARPTDRNRDLAVLLAIALARLLLHVALNGHYGFHRDELAVFADARALAWGYVAYPPLTPALGHVSQWLFGQSLDGFRFFAALAQCTALVLAGLLARELGGGRFAQLLAALEAAGLRPQSAKGVDVAFGQDLARAIQLYLAKSAAALAVLQIEDLIGMGDPVNVPGTSTEHANWQRKITAAIEDVFEDEPTAQFLEDIQFARSS